MNSQPAIKRSVALVIALAIISLVCLAIAIKADDSAKAGEKFADLTKEGESLFDGVHFKGWKFRAEDRAKVWSVAEVALDMLDNKRLSSQAPTTPNEAAMFRGDGHGTDIYYTEKSFGDCQVHVEFMIPANSNSGVYLMGEYEVQVLSNFGKPDEKLGPGDCGGIYHTHAPATNALKPYGQWNSYDILFRAPRFDAAGKKTENARFIEVLFNGKKIQENVEPKGPTGGELPGGEKPTGPLMLQGDHGICAFRNLRIKPLELK